MTEVVIEELEVDSIEKIKKSKRKKWRSSYGYKRNEGGSKSIERRWGVDRRWVNIQRRKGLYTEI